MTLVLTAKALKLSSFLHRGPSRVYNPLTDRTLELGEKGYDELAGLLAGSTTLEALSPEECRGLSQEGWLVEEDIDESERFFLKYVSLEAHTLCNQACYFCPVSVAPRQSHFMPTPMYENIVGQLRDFAHTLEAVFMINYNEPTADRRFVDQVRTLIEAGLPPGTLTNGTGLTPERIDAIVAMGGMRYLSVNLSTLDREKYRTDRGEDHLEQVMRHLDHAKDKPLADEMDIVVLGRGDEQHRADYELIVRRFQDSRFDVKFYEVMDRAGYFDFGLKARRERLCGCENTGSRPLQHLHITPHGKCVLCCEDYDEKYVVGDLHHEPLRDVLTGPALAKLRRWAYGVEEAPQDFICRSCIYARTE